MNVVRRMKTNWDILIPKTTVIYRFNVILNQLNLLRWLGLFYDHIVIDFGSVDSNEFSDFVDLDIILSIALTTRTWTFHITSLEFATDFRNEFNRHNTSKKSIGWIHQNPEAKSWKISITSRKRRKMKPRLSSIEVCLWWSF